MKPFLRQILSLSLFAILGATALRAGDLLLLGGNDRPSPLYAPGETMTFRVRLEQNGRPVIGTRLAWSRTGDDGRSESGEAVSSADSVVITASAEKPGFVRIRVRAIDADSRPVLDSRKKEVVFDGGAGVQPERLTSVPEPADFDAWWTAQKAALAQVPPEVLELKPVPPTHANVGTWDVKIACAGPVRPGDIAPKPVSGYLSKTSKAAAGSAEAIVYFHGYGVRSAIRHDQEADDPANPKLILDINAHGIENGQPAAFYEELARTKLAGYAFNTPENQRPETSYLHGMALRVLRALEFIKSRPEWDGRRLTVSGGSQGAFQAVLAAALDADVTRCDARKPWLCDLGGVKLGRLKGWRPDYTSALDYYDTVNLAKRIHATITITAGLGDYVCPPSGVSILYNNIPDTAPKRIEYQQGSTHAEAPPNMVAFVVGTQL